MLTKLLFAVRTGKATVGRLAKAFRVSINRNLPANEQQQRQSQQAPRVKPGNKQERRKHHCVIPIINPAGRAAAISHHPRLERTEKQNANQITDRICHAEQQ